MNNNFDQQDQLEDEGWQGGGGAHQAGEVKLDLSDSSALARFFCHTKCNELMIESTEYERPISCRRRRTRLFSWSILFVIFIMAEASLLIC